MIPEFLVFKTSKLKCVTGKKIPWDNHKTAGKADNGCANLELLFKGQYTNHLSKFLIQSNKVLIHSITFTYVPFQTSRD